MFSIKAYWSFLNSFTVIKATIIIDKATTNQKETGDMIETIGPNKEMFLMANNNRIGNTIMSKNKTTKLISIFFLKITMPINEADAIETTIKIIPVISIAGIREK